MKRPGRFLQAHGLSVQFLFSFMEKALTKKKEVAATKAAETSPSQEAKRMPEKSFRVDDCSASVWAREHVVQGKPRVFRTITLERSFKDRDGAWRYTKSFDSDSLGKIVTLCQQVDEYIADLRRHEAE